MTSHEINIASAREADLPQVVSLLGEVQLATYPGVAPGITAEAILCHTSGDWAAKKEQYFRGIIASGAGRVWVARTAGRGGIIGYCMVTENGQDGALGVQPAHQTGFVGPRLVLAAAEYLGTEKDMCLKVVPRTPAVTFYRRLGFLPTGRDLSDELSYLRGGQTLPLIELVLPAEAGERSRRKLHRLLSSRG